MIDAIPCRARSRALTVRCPSAAPISCPGVDMIDVHDETAKPRSGSSRALRFAGLVAIGVGLASLMPMLEGALERGSPPRASSARAASSKAEPPVAGATQRVAVDPALRPLPGLWRLAPPPAM